MAKAKKAVDTVESVEGEAVAAKGTQYEEVVMDDGSVVKFPGKRQLLKSSTLDSEGKVTTRFDFRNGEVRQITVSPSAELFAKFAAHGIEQKVGDEVAGLKDIEDMVLAVEEVIDRLNEGEWTAKRESSGLAGTSVLARALIQQTGKSPQAIKEYLKTKTNAEKLALRQNPKIAPIVAELEAKKKKKEKEAVDTDALLDELA